jgi:hypothetical protein
MLPGGRKTASCQRGTGPSVVSNRPVHSLGLLGSLGSRADGLRSIDRSFATIAAVAVMAGELLAICRQLSA